MSHYLLVSIILLWSIYNASTYRLHSSSHLKSLIDKNIEESSYINIRSESRKNLWFRKEKSSLSMSKHGFNPFASRNRNTNVKWYEAELESFYLFVQKQPLLSAKQEYQFGRALQMWTKIEESRINLQRQRNSSEKTSNEELAKFNSYTVAQLEQLYKCAMIAKYKLVNSNLKLVLAVVSRYRSTSIPNSELIAEGTRGLSKAALRFDHTRGFRFSTYATWYVHQAVNEYVRWKKHPAKMPSKYLLLQRKVKQFTTDHKAATGHPPSLQEIATALGQTHFDIMKVLSMQMYPQLLGTPMKVLDAHKGGKERSYEELLPSVYKPPLAQSGRKDLRLDMEKLMSTNLNDVERDILRLRLGLDDGRVKPIKEVGRRFKISWKQVRSVEKAALLKLMMSEEISDFVDSYHNS
mmetsp:Transcript_8568/g.11932  ORF Transcript_8568/g.11932 Transcript_8568/m.11932 type:complete len:408 (+) Transcript_8568:104-1327(+)